MKFSELNDKNYLLFAIKYYDSPQAVTEDDFYDDLKRFKYVKRLLKRYESTGILKTNLILNHLLILFNVFGEATVPLLFYKLETELWPCAKTFLAFPVVIFAISIPTSAMSSHISVYSSINIALEVLI